MNKICCERGGLEAGRGGLKALGLREIQDQGGDEAREG